MFLSECVTVFILCAALFGKTSSQRIAEQKVQSYTSCRIDNDCKPNSFCFGNDDTVEGKCKCLDGYELFRNNTYYECYKGLDLGDACEQNLQCQVKATNLAICNQYKICSCNDESNPYGGRCVMNVKLGDICMSDGNCYLNDGSTNGSHAFCVNGLCICRLNETPSQDRTRCLTVRQLGETCLSDDECASIPNSRCSEFCKCAAEYTLARNESACIKAATTFGEQCDFDGQCSEYLWESICNDGQCGCSQGFHGYASRCVRTRKIGEGCQEDEQCVYEPKLNENVKCENVCKCIYGNKEDGSCNIEKFVDNNSVIKLPGTISVNVIFGLTFFNFVFFV